MKTAQLLLVVGAFALGIAVGAYAMHHSRPVSESVSDTPLLTATLAAEVGTDIAYLYRLRDGRTDAVIGILEMRVDSDLVILSERIAALPIAERDPQQLKIIQMHRDYRMKFPYSNSVPYFSAGVTKAYTLLGDKEKP